MKKADDIKEKIINVTTGLIMESKGNAENITTRAIAEKANIGVGLVNYHFQTKENLVEICIQRIIKNVISSFKRDRAANEQQHGMTQLKNTAMSVADFLIENPEVSRISILGDNKNPKIDDNTMNTVKGFSHSSGGSGAPEGRELIALFALTSTMQSMFLRKDICSEIFGFDMDDKCKRDIFISELIHILFGGVDNE